MLVCDPPCVAVDDDGPTLFDRFLARRRRTIDACRKIEAAIHAGLGTPRDLTLLMFARVVLAGAL